MAKRSAKRRQKGYLSGLLLPFEKPQRLKEACLFIQVPGYHWGTRVIFRRPWNQEPQLKMQITSSWVPNRSLRIRIRWVLFTRNTFIKQRTQPNSKSKSIDSNRKRNSYPQELTRWKLSTAQNQKWLLCSGRLTCSERNRKRAPI